LRSRSPAQCCVARVPTGLYTRNRIADGKQTLVLLESDLVTELARRERLPVIEPWKPQRGAK
jgi:hypothetical protein